MKKSEQTIVIEKKYACSRDALWQALVDPAKMRQWFFPDIPDFRAETGFCTEFMVDAGERQFLHQWEVTEVVPGEKIAYRWRYAGYDGAALSVFELSGGDNSCTLRLSFPVEEDFSDEVPEFRREACLGGWEYFTGGWRAFSKRNILTHLDCGLARYRRLSSQIMNNLTLIPATLTLILLTTNAAQAQQDGQVSNVPADIRAMIEQSQAGSGFESMARMQVDVQFGEFLASLGNNPQQRQEVEDALVKVISDRAELSSEVAMHGGNAAQLETMSSYAYLRSQLAPLLNRSQLDLLDEQQGAVAERNLRNNYGQELTRIAPDVTEANKEMVLDILVPHMLFRGENADQRNQLAPDEIVNQQLMSLRDAREELQSRLTGIQLDQVNSFFNQIRSNLFLNQSMYDAQ